MTSEHDQQFDPARHCLYPQGERMRKTGKNGGGRVGDATVQRMRKTGKNGGWMKMLQGTTTTNINNHIQNVMLVFYKQYLYNIYLNKQKII